MPSIRELRVPIRITTQLPMAWRHQCGALNDSTWPSRDRGSICGGCRSEVRLGEVEARYLLAEVAE